MQSLKKHNQIVKEAHKRRSPGSKVRGQKTTKFTAAKFLAWDGEGIQHGDTQVYALLANSLGDYIINVAGLSTKQCLDFLTSSKYSNNTIHVCFGASYDTNMMLRDVSEADLRLLHKGHKAVRWGNYELEYRPRKCFIVRRFKVEYRMGKMYRCYDEKRNKYIFEKKIVLWDVFGFYQKKFVSVLKEWFKGTAYESKYAKVIKDIEQGKQKRGSFNESEIKSFVLPYCLAECYALQDLMKILHDYLTEAGLKLARWDGAGAVAASLMKLKDIKRHIRVGDNLELECYPQQVVEAAEYAYFGGWIEAFMFGDIRKKVYHYDICSAYPSKTRKLPSLAMGHWETIEYGNMLPLSQIFNVVSKLPSYWVGHIEWANAPVYGPCPFSWRNRLGTVTRPVTGRGWQWSPEILAAYKLFPNLDLKINIIHYFVPDENNIQPFSFIEEMYELRKELKARGIGMEKVLKLGLNSLYGKLAQSLGYNEERQLKPPYHCIIYAGIITSETRASLLEAAMQCPLAIISIATDGIYSLAPLNLDVGNKLGQWEYTEHESMTVVQPGFYWHNTNGIQKHYYRGFNEGCISRGDIIQAYICDIASIDIPTTRFITLGAAIGLNDFSVWRSWRTKDRSLDLTMSKSSKRVWTGETLPGDKQIRIARNKVFDPAIFVEKPELLDSKKYSFEWDEARASGIWDGQSNRTIVEEMFHMELSPTD